MPARAETCPQCGAPAETVYEEVKQPAAIPAPPTPAGPAYGYVPMPQQPLPPAKRGSRGLMVTGIVLLVLIFCCIVLFATCPDQKKHADIVSQRVAEAVEEMRDSMGVTNGLSIIDGVVDRVTRYAVSHQLRVDNYRLFSIGRFKTGEDKEETITFGVANHVFCFFTKEDLKKFCAVDLSGKPKGYQEARDIFLVGCWTAQRVSDYNNISRDAIQSYTKRTIVDVPDPENPGQTKPEIQLREVMYINIRQHKTGAKVAVPCSSELKTILERYDYQMPHLADQVINRYIKEIGEWAGIDDIVEMVETKGGKKTTVKYKKYKLIHSHTARRTGATLMYLSGMDVYDIMKITGHSSPNMLKKYIKADQLEVVDKIIDKYNYFD